MRELFDLVGRGDRRFSPFCWRARLALAHKGLDVEVIPCRYADKARIAFSGQDSYPVLRDGEQVIHDSWAIACYLEEAYPGQPSLFDGDHARNTLAIATAWFDSNVLLPLLPLLLPDVLDIVHPDDLEYFITSREKDFGCSFQELADRRSDADFERWREQLTPLRQVLATAPYFGGGRPRYADYLVVSLFQWARIVSPRPLLPTGDPLFDWRERMLACHDGLLAAATAFDT